MDRCLFPEHAVIEYPAFERDCVPAGIGGGEIVVDRVGMTVVVEVGAEEVNTSHLYEPFGHLLFVMPSFI